MRLSQFLCSTFFDFMTSYNLWVFPLPWTLSIQNKFVTHTIPHYNYYFPLFCSIKYRKHIKYAIILHFLIINFCQIISFDLRRIGPPHFILRQTEHNNISRAGMGGSLDNIESYLASNLISKLSSFDFAKWFESNHIAIFLTFHTFL